MKRSEAEVILDTAQKLVATMGHPDLVMTPLRARIYSLIAEDLVSITAADLASYLKKPLPSMSGTLRRMCEDGWLTRENTPQESGGYEWTYTTSSQGERH